MEFFVKAIWDSPLPGRMGQQCTRDILRDVTALAGKMQLNGIGWGGCAWLMALFFGQALGSGRSVNTSILLM